MVLYLYVVLIDCDNIINQIVFTILFILFIIIIMEIFYQEIFLDHIPYTQTPNKAFAQSLNNFNQLIYFIYILYFIIIINYSTIF